MTAQRLLGGVAVRTAGYADQSQSFAIWVLNGSFRHNLPLAQREATRQQRARKVNVRRALQKAQKRPFIAAPRHRLKLDHVNDE